MGIVSSSLLCQIAPLYVVKNFIKINSLLGYEPEPQQLVYEGWHVGFRLVVRRAYRGIKILKGFSTIISWREIAKAFRQYLNEKASKIEIEIVKKDAFRVTSSQSPAQKYFVYANPTSLTCSCMKFHCLRSRQNEAPKLFDNLKDFSLEIYDTQQMREETIQSPTCHHIVAVMKAVFGVSNLRDYVDVYRSVTSSITAMQDAQRFNSSPFEKPPPARRRNPFS